MKGILMVCMAGTAINLHNLHILGEARVTSLRELSAVNDRLKYLNSLELPAF